MWFNNMCNDNSQIGCYQCWPSLTFQLGVKHLPQKVLVGEDSPQDPLQWVYMWEGWTLGPTQKKPKVNLDLVTNPTQWGLWCFCLGLGFRCTYRVLYPPLVWQKNKGFWTPNLYYDNQCPCK
jgi:hypothetical protein